MGIRGEWDPKVIKWSERPKGANEWWRERNLWHGDLGDYLHPPCVTERIFCSSNPWQEGHLEGRTHFMSSWYLSTVDRTDIVIKMIKPQNTADKYIHLRQIIPSGFTHLSIRNCRCRWPTLPQARRSYGAPEGLAGLTPLFTVSLLSF